MKIDLELKSGTDRDVVASLRKIVALPIDHGQKVELAKRLILDSLVEVDKPAPIAAAKSEKSVWDVSSYYLDRMKERILQASGTINMRSRYRTKDDRPCNVGHFTQFTKLHPAVQVYVAECLKDPHLFAWAINSHGQTPLLMCWRSQHGEPPKLYSNLTLLTEWSLTVPPVPSI